MSKNIEDVEIGEEFVKEGFVYVKMNDEDAALVFDESSNDWKRPRVEH